MLLRAGITFGRLLALGACWMMGSNAGAQAADLYYRPDATTPAFEYGERLKQPSPPVQPQDTARALHDEQTRLSLQYYSLLQSNMARGALCDEAGGQAPSSRCNDFDQQHRAKTDDYKDAAAKYEDKVRVSHGKRHTAHVHRLPPDNVPHQR